MTDIVERLRKVESGPTRHPGVATNWHRNPDGPEAADEIERLRARLAEAETQMKEARVLLSTWCVVHPYPSHMRERTDAFLAGKGESDG